MAEIKEFSVGIDALKTRYKELRTTGKTADAVVLTREEIADLNLNTQQKAILEEIEKRKLHSLTRD